MGKNNLSVQTGELVMTNLLKETLDITKDLLEQWLECQWAEALIELIGGFLFLGVLFIWIIIVMAIS